MNGYNRGVHRYTNLYDFCFLSDVTTTSMNIRGCANRTRFGSMDKDELPNEVNCLRVSPLGWESECFMNKILRESTYKIPKFGTQLTTNLMGKKPNGTNGGKNSSMGCLTTNPLGSIFRIRWSQECPNPGIGAIAALFEVSGGCQEVAGTGGVLFSVG